MTAETGRATWNGDEPMTGTEGTAGVEGNSRLTSTTGLLLLLMLAVEGVTVLRVRQLITLHLYLGLMLLGPVALKTVATVYRFARYYSGSAPYVRKGPPHVVLRVLGPIVIVTSLTLLGSGVVLILQSGDRGGLWLTVHKVSFFAWFAAMTIHVLGHLRESLHLSYEELRAASRGRVTRLAIVTLSLALGVALAAALYPSATAWTSGHDRFKDGPPPAGSRP
jgi:hypothetical protein